MKLALYKYDIIIIIIIGSADEKQHYSVMSSLISLVHTQNLTLSLIGWAHTQNNPWLPVATCFSR